MGITADILTILIDYAVCQQEHLHAQLSRYHIFRDIVADHEAFLTLQTGSA
jgi:hypothetical protein